MEDFQVAIKAKRGHSGRLLFVSAIAVVHRRFGAPFSRLSEEEALALVEEFLGGQVRKATSYVVEQLLHVVLPAGAGAAAAPPPLVQGQVPQPHQHYHSQSDAKVLTKPSDPASQHSHFGATAATAANAAAAGSAAATVPAVAAIVGGSSGASWDEHMTAASQSLDCNGSGVSGASSRTAALLFAALVMSACGRGAPGLVRRLLEISSSGGAEAALEEPALAAGAHGSGGGAAARAAPALERRVVHQFLRTITELCRLRGCKTEQQQYMAALRIAIMGEDQAFMWYYGDGNGRRLPPGNRQYRLRGLHLTSEQCAVVQHVQDNHQQPIVTSVHAFVGTGQTTTARALVANLRHLKFLCLMYSKDMQAEVKREMQADLQLTGGDCNFVVSTVHGLALGELHVWERFSRRMTGDITMLSVRRYLASRWRCSLKKLNAVVLAAVRAAIKLYMTSNDPEVTLQHFTCVSKDMLVQAMQPVLCALQAAREAALQAAREAALQAAREAALQAARDADGGPAAGGDVPAAGGHVPDAVGDAPDAGGDVPDALQLLVEAAQALSQKLLETKRRMFVLPHDAYLKLAALKQLSLDKYDVILMDGAQAINRVTKQILIDQQPGKHVVLLGDKHHQMHASNDACGLMSGQEPIDAARRGPELWLRQTFRFGPEIAVAVNAVLKAAFKEPNFLIGREQLAPTDSVIHPGVVYVCLPRNRGLDTVRAKDLQVPPSLSLLFRDGNWRQMPFRLLQCPLRGQQSDPAFPRWLALTSVNPAVGAAVLPPSFVLGSRRPLVAVVARHTTTLVRMALKLLASGYPVSASFYNRQDDDGLLPLLQHIRDVFDFRCHSKRTFGTKHPLFYVKGMRELRGLADSGEIAELRDALQVVDTLLAEHPTVDVHALVDRIKTDLRSDWRRCDYYLTTVHKLKLPEAAVVQIAEDFVELSPTTDAGIERLARCRSSPSYMDELRAVYMAVSQAQGVLVLNRDLSRLVLGLHRKHVALQVPERAPPGAPPRVSQQMAPGMASQGGGAAAAEPSDLHAAVPATQLSTQPTMPGGMAADGQHRGAAATLAEADRIQAGSQEPGFWGGGGVGAGNGGGGGSSRHGKRRQRNEADDAAVDANGDRHALAGCQRPGKLSRTEHSQRASSGHPVALPQVQPRPAVGTGGATAAVAAAANPPVVAGAVGGGGGGASAADAADAPMWKWQCPVCAAEVGAVVDPQQLPCVVWQGRQLCRRCARHTVFRQVLDLAKEELQAAGAAAGTVPNAAAGAEAAAAGAAPNAAAGGEATKHRRRRGKDSKRRQRRQERG